MGIRMARKLVTAVVAVVVLGALLAPAAFAAKVANPGPVTFTLPSGTLDIRDEHFDAASADDPVTATGTVQANGNVSISSMNFPELDPIAGPLGEITATINVIGTPTGNVNPLNGVANLAFTVRIDLDGGGVGGDCHVGNIAINARTSEPGGIPYNPADGTVTLGDNDFAVPGASGCTTFPINVNNEINSQLGLPSPAGFNAAVFGATASPIIGRALAAAFTATPTSGVQPLDVNFDASTTFHTRPITSYQWDFDGNGTFDQTTAGPTASTTYSTPGTRNIKLRVTDADGDTAETTRTVVTNLATPDLTITKSHPGLFVTGQTGTYTLNVANVGTQNFSDTITVTDHLPAGLDYVSSAGTGWSCAPSGSDVICTSDEDLALGGAAAEPLTIDVVASGAGFFTNTATVAGGGDINPSNDTASDPTQVIQAGIDLTTVKTLEEDTHLRGKRSHYHIAVSNTGSLAATDRVRIVDELPAGLTFVSASGGSDWVCNFVSGQVRCFSDNDVAPGASLHDIAVTVEVATDAGSSIDNTASVSVSGESNAANDSSTHAGTVLGVATDYTLNKSHTGDFIKGDTKTYNFAVKNVGTVTGANTVTITDQLPLGLDYDGFTGQGWNCNALGQSVTCTNNADVEPGDSLPGLTISVKVHTAAAGVVTNTAAVFSDDDLNAANDVDDDPTDVRLPHPDLSIDKSHVGNFTANSNGSWSIKVRNVSAERADGPTVVTDTIPATVQPISASGSGWACNIAGQTVTCTRSAAITAGETAPTITVTGKAPTNQGGTNVINTASVANADDTVNANNSDSDPTAIDFKQTIVTTVEASPIVLNLSGTSNKVGVSAMLRDSAGNGIPGKTIRFAGSRSLTPLCTGVTDATGEARCQVNFNTLLTLLLNLGRYEVYFDGDLDYKADSDYNSILQIVKLKLL